MKTVILIASIIAMAVSLGSCSKNKEADDLAKAQDCLNKAQSNPNAASGCMQYVAAYDSQQADILKCSIETTEGGLTQTKIVNAYNELTASSDANKNEVYMETLVLDYPDVDQGYTHAVNAYNYCSASQVSGLVYLTTMILEGTTAEKAIFDATGGSLDSGTLDTMVSNCASGGPGSGSCPSSDQISQMAGAATTVANTYCASPSADKDVCSNYTKALDASGGDSTLLINNLMCMMNGKTYSGGSCH